METFGKMGNMLKKASHGTLHAPQTVWNGLRNLGNTLKNEGVLAGLLQFFRHMAHGYEVFTDNAIDLESFRHLPPLPSLTPQQQQQFKNAMARQAKTYTDAWHRFYQ
jgi:hypothetical protein